jgi:hypothetical protein
MKHYTSDMLSIANIVKDTLNHELKPYIQEPITEATKAIISSVSHVYEDRIRKLELWDLI